MLKKFYYYIFLIFIIMFVPLIMVKAENLSDYYNVDVIKVCGDELCNVVYDEENGVNGLYVFLIKFSWSLHSPTPIQEGDYVEIPFASETNSESSSIYKFTGFSWTDIYDDNNNLLGQWKVEGDESERKLSIRFEGASVGKTDLNGIFTTSKNIYVGNTYRDKVIPLTVGNKRYYFKVNTYDLPEAISGFTTSCQTSNNLANITLRTQGITAKQLYGNNGLSDDAIFNDLRLEVPISSAFNASLSDIVISAEVYPPVNLKGLKAGRVGFSVDATSSFNKVLQSENESYLDFKNRLEKYQYGIYDDGTNKTLVVNFGDQPSKDATYLDYVKKIDSSYADVGDYFKSVRSFAVDSDVRDIINSKFGQGNSIGGKVVLWAIKFNLNFSTVKVKTTKKFKSFWSWKNVNEEVNEHPFNFDIVLSPPSSTVAINGTSQFLLKDYSSKNEIVGATVKLQKQNGDIFEDIGEKATDSAGSVEFRDLESGVYRYIQTGYLGHYLNNSFKMYSDSNMTNVIETFSFDSSTGNIIYATNEREKYSVSYMPGEHGNFNKKTYSNLYHGDITPNYDAVGSDGWLFKGWSPQKDLYVTENKTYTALWKKNVKVTTKYLEDGTNTPLLEEIIDVNENDTDYSTVKKDIDNYEFVRVEGNESGNRGENDIVVTYYYKKKESNLNIKYLDCSTRREIASSTSQKLYYGDNYDSDTYEVNIIIPENYNRISANKTDNYKGIVSSDNINVEYCYNKKDSKLNSSITMNGTDKINSSKDKVSYQIDYSTIFTDYIGETTITVVATLPYKIDINSSNLDDGVYDDKTNTITWNINASINSYDNSEYKATKNIELFYINIDLAKDVIINQVAGKTVIDDKTSTAETTYNSYIDIKGTINVSYVDDSGKELLDKVTTTDKVGKTYELIEKSIEGYKIINKPKEKVYEYKEGVQNLEYVYDRIKYKIVTKALNEGGTITGDEEVYYGDDSKENNINIEANDGYYISKVIINDKEIKILEKQTKLTIPNFIKMTEDKNINVEFEKYSTDVVVPNTLKNSILKTIGIIVVLSSVGFILYTLYKKKLIFNK